MTIVGARAGELLLPWSLVMGRRAGRWALSEAIVAYPTRSELSQGVAFAAYEAGGFGPAARRWARALGWARR